MEIRGNKLINSIIRRQVFRFHNSLFPVPVSVFANKKIPLSISTDIKNSSTSASVARTSANLLKSLMHTVRIRSGSLMNSVGRSMVQTPSTGSPVDRYSCWMLSANEVRCIKMSPKLPKGRLGGANGMPRRCQYVNWWRAKRTTAAARATMASSTSCAHESNRTPKKTEMLLQ